MKQPLYTLRPRGKRERTGSWKEVCSAAKSFLRLGVEPVTLSNAKTHTARGERGERTKAGLAAAKARGVKLGRPFGSSKLTIDYDAFKAAEDSGISLRQIARDLGISATTARRISRAIKGSAIM